MRAAPPVHVNLGSGRREQAAIAALWSTAGGVAAAWLAALGSCPLPGWSAAFGALAFALLGWQVASPMCGRLSWDGHQWNWQPAGNVTPRRLSGFRLALDLGSWVLLCDDAGHWCGVGTGDAPSQWHALHVALHSVAGHARAGQSP